VAYDWKQLERDEDRRVSQSLRPLAITWIVLGLVGAVVALATGHLEKLTGLIVWFVLGVGLYLATRRSPKGQESSHDAGGSPTSPMSRSVAMALITVGVALILTALGTLYL
jgi:hydrogenase/urease accessory protein HupE